MNICIEYLMRTGLIEHLTTFPCSFFLSDISTGRKVAMCIYEDADAYSVRRWNLYDCNDNQALPAMEEHHTDDVFNDSKVILKEMEILRCRHSAIPSRENTIRRPMERYNLYFDNYLETFELHNRFKERWLWNTFLGIYCPDLIVLGMSIKRAINMYGEYAAAEIMENQRDILMIQAPKLMRYWEKWRKHMLDFKGIPGEFVFATHFNKAVLGF